MSQLLNKLPEDLRTRVSTAVILVVCVLVLLGLAAFWNSGRWLLLLTVFLLTGLCAIEFSGVCSADNNAKRIIYAFAVSFPALALLCSISSAAASDLSELSRLASKSIVFGFYVGAMAAVLLVIIEGRNNLEAGVLVARDLFVGLILVGLGGAALGALTLLAQASSALLWLLLVICLNDIAAYFVGKSIGGPKLAPAISPNKTQIGSLAGLLVGTGTGFLCSWLLEGSAFSVLLLALGCTVVAQIGDLTKSYLKRLHGVKDTGMILPGHGGLLDRVDGILLSSPLLWVVSTWGL